MSTATKTTTPAKTPSKGSNKPVPFSTVVNSIAKNSGKGATDVGKAVRSHIRKNEKQLVKDGWKGLAKHEPGNRYPDMPRAFANKFIAARVATLSRGGTKTS